jgi:hypothetical protein
MTQQIIDIGIQGNDGTGDSIRTSFNKVNQNFTEIYAIFGAGGSIKFGNLADAPGSSTFTIVSASGNGTQATLNFANPNPGLGLPFSIGQNIVITGTLPSGYNGAYTVTNATPTSVTFANTTTAAITQTGKIAGTAYSSNQVIMASTTGNSLTARDIVGINGITIDASDNNQLIIGSNSGGLITDPQPTLGTHMNADQFIIGNLADPDPSLVTQFNAVFASKGYTTTIGQMAVTVNYANNHYLQVTNGQVVGPLRVRAQPTVAQTNDPDYDPTLSGNYVSTEAIQRKDAILRSGDKMAGTLTLSDHPGSMAGAGTPNGADDLQAATKFYVDNNTHYSNVNLYVSTGGDDTQRKTPLGREGRAPQYAYKTVGAAALQAQNLINLSFTEPGPYRQTVAYTIGPSQYTSSVTSVSFSGGNSGIQGYLDAASLLESNKTFIQNETLAYLNQKYVNTFTFDKTRYSNIISDIVDGVAYDLVLGTNFNSTTQASILFNAYNSDVVGNLSTIIAAIQNAESQILNYSYNTDNTRTYIGKVINALCYDLEFGSNFQSIQVGLGFKYANTGLETTPTVINTVATATSGTAIGTDSSISGTTLVVGGSVTGTFAVGMTLSGIGITPGTTITALGTGTGGAGSYTISTSYSGGLSHVRVTGVNNRITVSSTQSMVVGSAIVFTGTSFGNLIAGNTYYINSIPDSANITISSSFGGSDYSLATATGSMVANTTAPSEIASALTNLANQITLLPAVSSTPSIVNSINAILKNISDIIVTGTLPAPTYPPVTTGTGFSYNSAKCARDVGLIVNAVLDDIIFNTNYRSLTAAFAYLRSYSNVVTTSQKAQTIAGINNARDQIIALVSSNNAAVTAITGKFGIITTIINNVSASGAPSVSFTNPGNTAVGIVNGAAELQSNRQFLIDETIAYVKANLSPNSIPLYDETSCRRDTGYIVDALTFDLLYGGNSATVVAADAYFNGVTSTISQETTAVASAFTHLQAIIGNIIQANTSWTKTTGNVTNQSTVVGVGSPAAASTVSTLLGYVIAIVNGGTSAGPAVIAPTYANGVNYSSYSSVQTTILSSLTSIESNVITFLNETYVSSTGQVSAVNLLLNNINFIQAEIVAYLLANYPTVTYNKATCQRDVKYIIWALCYDITYGGNSQSIYAGLQYWINNAYQIAGYEQAATVSAIGYLGTIAQNIVQNQTPVKLYQTGVIQYANTTLSGGSVATSSINTNIGTIQSIVASSSQPSVSVTYPTTSAVASTLTTAVAAITADTTTLESNAITYIDTNFPVLNNSIQKTTITNLFNTVTNILNGGIGSRTRPTYATTGFSSSIVQAQSAILANIDFITAETNAWINSQYPGVTYDPVASARDLSFVLEAIVYDITYGGSAATTQAANQYYANGVAQLVTGLPSVCSAALNHALNVTQNVVSNSLVTPSAGNYITTTGASGDGVNVTITFAPQATPPYSIGQVIAIQGVTPTGYNTNNGAGVTVTNCTTTSVTFASTASGAQTIAGKITKQVLNSSWTQSYAQSAVVNTLFGIVTGVIGSNSVATPVYPVITSYDNALQATFGIITNNTYTISNNVVTYLTNTFSGGFSYNEATCYRDLGYIIDGQVIDLLTDGTYQSITAGKSYYKNVSAKAIAIGSQYSETVDGIQFAQQLAIQVLNQTVQTRYQTLISQVTDNTKNATVGTNVATGTFVSNTTTTLTLTSITGVIVPGMVITGTGFTNSTPVTITSILNSSTVSISAAPAGTPSGTITLTATPVTTLNANMNTIISIINGGVGAAPTPSFGSGYYTVTFSNGGNGYVDQGQAGSNHIIPGKILVGDTSSSYGQIVSYVPGVSSNNDTVTLNMTRPGFFAYIPTTATATAGSTTLTVTATSYTTAFNSTSNIVVGLGVTGVNIPLGATVTAIIGNTVTISTPTLGILTSSNVVFGELLDFGETVSEQNITIYVESGIYYEDYPIKLSANVTIRGDDFRRTIIRPLNRISQSPWRNVFFYRDTIIDGMQLGLINFSGTDYAAATGSGATLSGTTGNITITLTTGQASPTWIGKVIVDQTSETGIAGKAVINTVSGNVMNCTVVYPFAAVITYPSGSWHMYDTINYGRHYLTNPSLPESPSNPALNNKLMDVFLTNDANRVKLITCQGHGGFMMVLDPEGQIKTKSPYAQESASFSGSINRKRFAGGQFIDGFAGRLFGTITGVSNSGYTITVTGSTNSGLDVRAPQTPCAFYVQGNRYQINNVLSYNNTTATVVLGLDTSTPFYPSATYSNSLLYSNIASVVDGISYDMAFGSNYQSIKTGITFLQPANSVVGLSESIITQSFSYVATQINALPGVDSPGKTAINNNVTIINNIINNGIFGNSTAGIPTVVFPNPANVTANVSNAKLLLQANKAFIQAEVVARVSANYNVGGFAGYSALTLSNNIGFAIDAITYDLLYGGTSSVYDVAQWMYFPALATLYTAAMGYLGTVAGQIVQKTNVTRTNGNTLFQVTTGYTAATSTQATTITSLCAVLADYTTDGTFGSSTRTLPTVSSTTTTSSLATDFNNIQTAKSTLQSTTITYANNGSGIVINIEMGGNKSMLANDFTQINDLGYGILCTNAGLTEQVSTFTYYCYTAYWALNGGQIRSVAGSNSNGVFGLRGTGSDVTELPNAVNLAYNMVQSARVYKQGAYSTAMQPTSTQQALTVYITNWEYLPAGTSELEIDHTLAGGGIARYEISTVAHTPVNVNGQNVLSLTLSTSGNNQTSASGLQYALYDGQIVTIRVLSNIKFYNISNVKPVRPSTALQYSNNLASIYRIIAYNLTEATGEALPAHQSLLQMDTSFAYYKFVVDTTNMYNADPSVYITLGTVALSPASTIGTTLYVVTSSLTNGAPVVGQYVGGYGYQNCVVTNVTTSGANTVITTSTPPSVAPVGNVWFSTTTMGAQVGDNKIAVLQISDTATISQLNSGTYVFGWAGRTHRVISYVVPQTIASGSFGTGSTSSYTLVVNNVAGTITPGQIVTGNGFNGTQTVSSVSTSIITGTSNIQATITLSAYPSSTPSGTITFGGANTNGYLQIDPNPVINISAVGTGVSAMTYQSNTLETGSTTSKIVTFNLPYNSLYTYPPVDSFLTVTGNANAKYNGSYQVTSFTNASQLTVASTTSLQVGMVVSTSTSGAFIESSVTNPSGTTIIQSIDSPTQFTVAPAIWAPVGTTINAILVATVASITISNAGSGYTSAPTIIFSGGGAASQALATCSIVNGSISQVVLVSPGYGYTSVPTITLSGNSGSVFNTTIGTNLITLNSSANLQVNQVIIFGGSVFGGIVSGTQYYIASINGNQITISASTGGVGIITLTTASGAGMTWSTPGNAVLTPVLTSSPTAVVTTLAGSDVLQLSLLYPTDPGTSGNATATSNAVATLSTSSINSSGVLTVGTVSGTVAAGMVLTGGPNTGSGIAQINSYATTATSGNGTTVTISFSAQTFVPYAVGQTIFVSGVTPAGYNGTYIVTAATTSSVSYTNATTGAQTIAGTVASNVYTYITANISGSGAGSTWQTATSQGTNFTVASSTITGTNNLVTLSSNTNVSVGNTITFAGTAFGNLSVATVSAGSFVVGQTYTITSVGSNTTTTTTTNFTLIGAPNNNVGTVFTATGAGSGSGQGLITYYITEVIGSSVGISAVKGGTNVTLTGATGASLTYYTPGYTFGTSYTATTFGSVSGTGPYLVTLNIPTTTAPTTSVYYYVSGNSNALYNGYWQATSSTTTSITLSYPYNPGTYGISSITTVTREATSATSSSLGLARPFNPNSSTTLRLGYPATGGAQITVRISTCRATGHDFLDIGTGGFITTNYPNQIYGNAALSANESNDVVEETTGRVFHVSTDQNGIFRVGRFFKVDQGTGTVTFSASIALSNLDGLGFKRGVVVSEFSTDPYMTENAADVVPVQSAVRSFMDYRLGLDYGGSPVPTSGLIGPGFLPLNGVLSMKGNLNMASYTIGNLTMPVSNVTQYDAANRGYVDANATALNNLYKLNDVATGAIATYVSFSSVGNTVTLQGVYGTIVPGMVISGTGFSGGQVVLSVNITPGATSAIGGSGTVTLNGPYNTTPNGVLTFNNLANGNFIVYDSTFNQWTNIVPPTGTSNNNQVAITYTHGTPGYLTATIQPGVIVNSMVSTSAAIAQSKLALQPATAQPAGQSSYVQSTLGLSSFNNQVFTSTNGWINLAQANSVTATYVSGGTSGTTMTVSSTTNIVPGMIVTGLGFTSYTQTVVSVPNGTTLILSAVADGVPSGTLQFSNSGIGLSYLQQIGTGYVLGNRSGISASPQLITPGNIVADGDGLKNALFSIPNTVSSNVNAVAMLALYDGATTTNNQYGVIGITTTGVASKLVKTGSDGSISAALINVGGYKAITSSGSTISFYTPGQFSFMSSQDVSGSSTTTINGVLNAAGTLITTTLETGASVATTGTITGQWSLGALSSINASAGTLQSNNLTSGSASTAGTFTGLWTFAQATTMSSNLTVNGTIVTPTISSPTISGAITTTNITTGDAYTAGTITGAWSLSANSTLQATYADLAEYYEGDAQYEPGTVLVFGGDKEVTTTDMINDTRSAGVVTTNPAYVMNSEQTGIKVCLALAGRIPCKVVGRVKKGDMLTTSATPGYAVKALTPTLGAIIGKALEDKDYGEAGVIQIAVGRA